MAVPEIVTATVEHIEPIAADIREADRAELWAAALISSEAAMRDGLRISDFAYTGLIDGEPVCMFGVSPASLIGGVGRPWMVGTSSLDRHAMIFLRRCRGIVGQMQGIYPLLENYVDCRNVKAIAWLKWLGFQFDEPVLTGAFNLPFRRFERRR